MTAEPGTGLTSWQDAPTHRPRKQRHVIGDIRYSPNGGPCWSSCDTDGETFAADSPDALADLWRAHGGTTMEPWRVAARASGIKDVTVHR